MKERDKREEAFYKIFSGTASRREITRVRKWFAAREENKEEYYRHRRLFDAMIVAGPRPPGTVGNGFTRPRHRFSAIARSAAAAVACVVLSIGAGRIISELRPAAMTTIHVPAGQRLNLLLEDSTSIWLNSGTTLTYPTVFGRTRDIRIDGEAYIDVAHDPSRPFRVKTGSCLIEVLGTRFNVDSYSARGHFSAALIEGSLRVSMEKGNRERVILSPSQMVTLEEDALVVSSFDPDDSFGWKDGIISFTDETFANIVHEFEKFFGIDIVVRDPDRFTKLYTGKFRQNDGIDYALGILRQDIRFRYLKETENNKIYID